MKPSSEMKAGPSEDYRALLRGDINSEEYVRRLMADVDARLDADRARKRATRKDAT